MDCADVRSLAARAACCLLASLFFLLGGSPEASFGEEKEGAEAIVLQLRWLHQFQFAGYYAAIEKGFYDKAGLKVTLVEGGYDKSTIREVLDGRAQYGVTNSEVLLHYLKGEPLIVVAAVFQHSPLALVSHRDKGLTTPQHLIGRRVKMTRRSRDVELHAMLQNEGVAIDDIQLVEGSVGHEDYFNESLDALSAYITNEPFYLRQRNIPFNIIRPITYGIDFYGDCLFTSRKELEEHPWRVEAFREASLRGWRYAMDHPNEMIQVIKEKYVSLKSRDHLVYEAEAVRDLIIPDLVEIGHMNPGRWRHIADVFIRLGWADPGYSLDAFLYDPDPRPDMEALRRLLLVSFAGLVMVFAVVGVLLFFNRRLKLEVQERLSMEETLKKSEERFRVAFHTSPDSININRVEDGAYVDVNEGFCRIMGYSRSQVIGRSSLELKVWDDEKDSDLLLDGLKKNGYVSNLETRFRTKEGRIRTGLVSARLLLLDEKPHILSVTRDITERKEVEEEKRKLESQLQHAQKMEAIGTLAGGVAHDFNNLLQAINGYTELLLLRKPSGDPDHRPLKQIQSAGNKAARLVQQLLAFSRKAESDRQPMDLNREVLEATKILERTIPKMIKVKLKLQDDLRMISADSTQIEQILLNLGANASDAMSDGGEIVIETENIRFKEGECINGLKEERPYVALTFADNGHGMDSRTLQHIFEPFYTTKEIGKGTGLGLASVYGIVKAHEGHVTCHSKLSQGTTFKIYFPAVEAAGNRDLGHSVEAPGRRGTETVLIVDDEPSVREFTSGALEHFGYKVMVASCGEEALEIFSKNKESIDLVILDLNMPGMGGYKCSCELAKANPHIKIIVASGYALDKHPPRDASLNKAVFIDKPYNLDDLLTKVRKVLDS